MNPIRIAVLGSTGSIGTNTLRTVKALKGLVEVELLAARGGHTELLAQQAAEFAPSSVVVTDPEKADAVRAMVPASVKVHAGMAALCQELHSEKIDLVLVAIAGSEGLMPTLETLRAGKKLALATKEALVMGGKCVTTLAKEKGIRIFPVDSEHSAIFQCLEGRDPASVKSLILTASGGPFRTWTREQMEKATWADALKHPTWNMGPKVSIDSASLMNKALEMVEASWLFNMPGDKIEVSIHPQSIVHSMIRLLDGTVIAQLGMPDMRFPIQYALTWPERIYTELPQLDFAKCGKLEFFEATAEKYPSIGFAREALAKGGTYSTAMNAANEIALERFRKGEIPFTGIWSVVGRTMEAHESLDDSNLDAILEADRCARQYARSVKI